MQAADNITDYKILSDQLLVQNNELQIIVATLRHELAQMKKIIFGSRNERFVPTEDNKPSPQLKLDLDAETIAQCKITATTQITYTRTKTEVTANKPKAHPGRMKLPENLRRETIVLPGRMMEKCMASEAVVAQIVVDKYMDHLPLHRQQQRFARVGLIIAQSTINGWVKNVLLLFVALYELHKQQVLNCGYLNVDETGIRVLDDDIKGKTHRGFYWVYHSQELKASLFDYQPGRGREGPNNILEKYTGFLQTDAYATYDKIGARQGIVHLGCMAHARRYFVDALGNDGPRADHALKMFQQLYAIEARIKTVGLQGDEIVQLRQQEAVPVLQSLKQWITEEYIKVRPASPIGKAMAYCLPLMDKLTVYTTNARLGIDNNPVENAIRPIAIGRKNYLFAGSHEAAQRAAMMYSFFNTCRLHKINPYEWLKDVLERMHLYNSSNLHELLPQNWIKLKNTDMG